MFLGLLQRGRALNWPNWTRIPPAPGSFFLLFFGFLALLFILGGRRNEWACPPISESGARGQHKANKVRAQFMQAPAARVGGESCGPVVGE